MLASRTFRRVGGAQRCFSSFADPSFLLPLSNGRASAYTQKRLDPVRGNVPWIDRLARAYDLGFVERKPLSTVAHKAIANDLGKLVDMLTSGLIIPEGGSTLTFSGCKGIGKTETLKNMCCAVPLYKPSVVPIFVTFKGVAADAADDCGRDLPVALRTIVADALSADHPEVALRLRQPTHQFPPHSPRVAVGDVVRALFDADRRLLLIADEVEHVYMLQNDPACNERARQIIGTLELIGTDTNSRVVTVLCGSSASLTMLLQKKIPTHKPVLDNFFHSFPQAPLLPKLNGNKFQNIAVPTPSLADIDDIDSIISTFLETKRPIDPRLRNAIMYACGSSVRSMQRFCHEIRLAPVTGAAPTTDAISDQAFADKDVAITTYMDKTPTIHAVRDRLYTANKTIFDQVPDDASTPGAANIIAGIDWTQLKGVKESQLHDDIGKLLGADRAFDAKIELDYLLDRQWFARTTIGGDRIIFPTSPQSILDLRRRRASVGERAKSAYVALKANGALFQFIVGLVKESFV